LADAWPSEAFETQIIDAPLSTLGKVARIEITIPK